MHPTQTESKVLQSVPRKYVAPNDKNYPSSRDRTSDLEMPYCLRKRINHYSLTLFQLSYRRNNDLGL